ncbi:MAG: hypothetical protein FVQ83_11130 [Chloroflexi bacterium]|nr:hypothetical protein [Chloroflexota bacterium]
MWNKNSPKFLSWGSVMGAVGSAAKTAYELLTLMGETGDTLEEKQRAAFVWFVVFVILIGIAIWVREAELRDIKRGLPVIKLHDYGFEVKEWVSKPPDIAVYIEVKNVPHPKAIDANAEKVYPQITWEDLISGQILEPNPGRWLIPNREKGQMLELQTVNLDANGKAKRLYFGAIEKHDGCIRAIWRNDGDKYLENVFRDDHKHQIILSLTDTKGASAEFIFMISKHQTQIHPYYVFRLDRIGEGGERIEMSKKFNLKDLPDQGNTNKATGVEVSS